MEQNVYIWQEKSDGTIRLLRVFGNNPILQIPKQIDGKIVTELGAYCFARESRWKTQSYQVSGLQQGKFELSGKAVEEIVLPDSVTTIGRCAFYNCTELKKLELGRDTTEFGSDAFLNCKSLHTVVVRSGVHQSSGIRCLLAQVTWDVEVWFQKEQTTEAILFYPEYREYYDEIGPAHIFCMNIEGEGFRLRKAFQDEKVDFSLYDAAFAKASAQESELALEKLALFRLRYPIGLSRDAAAQYEKYLQERQESVFVRLLKEKDLASMEYLITQQKCDEALLTRLMVAATTQGWPEGAAQLMHWKQQKPQESRYTF